MHPLDALCASLKKEFDSARLAEAHSARAVLSSELNEFVRRLRSYKGEHEWISVILDGASLFSDRVVVFATTGTGLAARGSRGLEIPGNLTLAEPLPRALESVIHSRDAVIALRTPAEVGSALSSPGADRALLLPVLNEERVVAVLVALGSGEPAVSGLELIAVLAGMVLERRANSKQTLEIRPIAAATKKSSSSLPPWSHLGEAAREIHVRAQRFARVRVAEMQLAHSDAARAGREQGNLYLFLKGPVNAARESYRSQFMQAQQVRDTSMLDYLHLEMVRTLVEGDESRLGDEYPGPLQ